MPAAAHADPVSAFLDARRVDLRGRATAVAAPFRLLARDAHEPRACVAALAEAGLLRHCVPAAYGGAETFVEPLSLVVVREALSQGSGMLDSLFAVQGLGAHPLAAAASPEVRARWLPRLARGEALAAFAMTEPGAGSDTGAVATRARRRTGGYSLSGDKIFISNATIADVMVVLARVDAEGDGGAEQEAPFTAFAVPMDTPGVSANPLALMAAHAVGAVRLRDVQLPASARLGEEGEGLKICLATLELFRPTVGAAACGLALRAFEEARRRTSSRKMNGAPLIDKQPVQFALAEMATDIQAARGLVHGAAWTKEQSLREGLGLRQEASASMAKLFATEMAQRVVDGALQLHGAAGLMRGAVVEALYREVRALRIYEGTSEVQKMVIARAVLTSHDLLGLPP